MQGNIKFKFNSKEKDIYFIPENFEDLKDLFSNLFDEKITREIIFTYFDENDECFIDSEGYDTFLEYANRNENAVTIIASYENHSLGDCFSNVSVESEYPEKEIKVENKSFTFGDEKTTENINFRRGETPDEKYINNEEKVSQNNYENIENPYRKDHYMEILNEDLIKKK